MFNKKNDLTKYYLEFLCQKYHPQQQTGFNNNSYAKSQYSQNYTNSTNKNKPSK